MESKKVFLKYNDEGIIIGRLLVAYADLELSLFHCVNVTRDDFDTVYKAMFKERGESRRITMADTFGRQNYHKLGLGTQFEMAISSVRFCLKIRNQYAHCIWYDDYSGALAFANLEEGTESNNSVKDFKDLTIRHIDVSTLGKQEEYFEYTDILLSWVNSEGRRLAGKPNIHPQSAPKQLKQPPLYMHE
jgi:hypothetical protein